MTEMKISLTKINLYTIVQLVLLCLLLEALRARETAILYQNPLFPDETEAVYLPDEKRYYRGPDTPLPDLSDVTALLAQAKALHDELEAIYNPHVDFARVYALANSHALRLFKEDVYKRQQLNSLIKSGGGNGPMKPGNLRMQGAKSGEGIER